MRRATALILLVAASGCTGPLAFDAQTPADAVLPPAPLPESALVRIGGDPQLPPEPPDFASLELPGALPPEGSDGFRISSLRDSAMSWGARAGQSRRSWEIAEIYSRREDEMDAAWDFSRVAALAPMETGRLLPPVIQRGGAVWLGSERNAEAATEYYAIHRPARITGRLPGWRDYLPWPSAPPGRPPDEFLPQPGEEEQWREWAAVGWKAGVSLAEAELEESLARLERDYTGMLEFRRLLAMGMVSDMIVEAEHWPASVAGDGEELRIDGRRVRIVSDAGFVADTGRWRPQVVPVRSTEGWAEFPEVIGRR